MKFSLEGVFLFLVSTMVFGSGVGYGKVYLFHIVLALFFLVWLYVDYTKHVALFRYPKSGFVYFLYIMFIWYALSFVWSIQPLYTLRYLYYIALGVFIVFIINSYIHTRHAYQKVFKVLAGVFLLAIFIGLLEAFSSFRLPTSPYSDYSSYFGRLSSDLTVFDSNIQFMIRRAPTSFWGNPNNFSVAMVILLPFFWLSNKVWIIFIGSLSIFIVVLMAGSRGALLAFVFGLIVYMFIKKGRYWFISLISVVILGSVFYLNIDALKSSENKRVADIAWSGVVLSSYLFEEAAEGSIGYRQELMKNGIEALWGSGGLGVGGGGSQAVQELKGGVGGKLTSMHNFWVEVLVDAGVVFFVLFVTWYGWLCLKLYLLFKKSKDPFYQYHSGSLFISLILFGVVAISASSVIYLFSMWLLFAMSISLLRLKKIEGKRYESCTSCRG